MIYYELSPSQLEAKANELIERHDKEEFDFMLFNPPFGTPWKTDLKA